MTNDQKIIKNRLGLLELANQLRKHLLPRPAISSATPGIPSNRLTSRLAALPGSLPRQALYQIPTKKALCNSLLHKALRSGAEEDRDSQPLHCERKKTT